MILILLIIGSLIASLIPALIVKFLVEAIFKRRVAYLSIVFAMALTHFFGGMLVVFMGYDNAAALDAMPEIVALMISALAFVIQLIALNIIAFDQRGESIGMGRWAVVLVAMYALYFALAFTFVMLILI